MRYAILLLICAVPVVAEHNHLTPAEKSAGWKLLFDGKTLTNWIDPSKKTPAGDAWTIEDSAIKAKPDPRITEDLFTKESFGDFELQFDWKIAPGANSGLKYRIQDTVWLPDDSKKAGEPFEVSMGRAVATPFSRKNLAAGGKAQDYVVGFEYQMIDDSAHKDAQRGGSYQSGALYDMVPPSQKAGKAPGEWNQGRIVVRGDHIEHWLNGVKVVDGTLKDGRVAASITKRWGPAPKVQEMLLQRSRKNGPISLQNHSDDAWFRNIKIRKL
jgi:hypothetical protein